MNTETNILLLDEPTNHLDVDAKAELKHALQEYKGSILLICHEPEFYQDVYKRQLLLGTGIRVSECVGLDVEDVDFKNDAIRVVRKGGSEMMIYFGDEVEQALLNYLEDRAAITPVAGHEHALFYSTQRKRIGLSLIHILLAAAPFEVSGTGALTGILMAYESASGEQLDETKKEIATQEMICLLYTSRCV